MSTQPEDWRNEVFFPVPPPGTKSLEMLETRLRKCLAGGGEIDGEMLEDVRLFILARLYQQRTQSQVEDELVGWGMDVNYTIELVRSTRCSGDFGGEVTEEFRVGGRLAANWRNPYAAESRLAKRVARQHAEARRMAGLEPEDACVDLGFQPQALPAAANRSLRWRMILVAVLTVAVVAFGCGGVARLLNLL